MPYDSAQVLAVFNSERNLFWDDEDFMKKVVDFCFILIWKRDSIHEKEWTEVEKGNKKLSV